MPKMLQMVLQMRTERHNQIEYTVPNSRHMCCIHLWHFHEYSIGIAHDVVYAEIKKKIEKKN